MLFSKDVGLWLAVFLFSSVSVGRAEFQGCGLCKDAPPEGAWLMTGFVKFQGPDGPEFEAVKNVVWLTREPNSAYRGKGVGVLITNAGGGQAGQQFVYDILAVYDNKTSIMSVSIYNCGGGPIDAAQWTYDCGSKLGGPVINTFNGTLTPFPIRQELEFLV